MKRNGRERPCWEARYTVGFDPSTVSSYEATIRNYLKPGIGVIRLDALTTHNIQEFYNSLRFPAENRKE